jgi:hypothetical protein
MLPYRVASIFFLALLFGFFVIAFGWFDQINVQGSVYCDPQSSSSEDCPTLGEVETDNDDNERGNIEEQIPSVIPFP